MGIESIEARARKAAARYLAVNGYQVIEEDYEGFIVAEDHDGSLQFNEILVSESGMPEDEFDKEKFERVVLEFLTQRDFVDVRISPCTVSLSVTSGDRALLRHHKNCLS